MSRRHNRHKFSVDIKWRNQQSELVTGELLWRALKPDIFKVHRFLKMISRFINSVFARRRLDRQWCCGAGNRWFTRCRCVIDTYTSARRAQKLSTSTRCDSDIIHRAKVFASVIQINKREQQLLQLSDSLNRNQEKLFSSQRFRLEKQFAGMRKKRKALFLTKC